MGRVAMLIPPTTYGQGAVAVQMLGFSKRFGSLRALDDVSLQVAPGSMHALLGENGAGKSTLVKSLIGFYKADSGSVLVDGRERAIESPRDAAALGIGMIFQHFTVVPGMTVAENLVLAGRHVPWWLRWGAERDRLQAFMQTAPFALPLNRPVAELAAGEKQKLEILKALYTQRRFLVLDEPTSVLTPLEADEVLGQVKALCQQKRLTVLIITHKFREVFGYCDAVTVLRRGRLAGAAAVADTDRSQLAAWMMGQDSTTDTSTAPRSVPNSARTAHESTQNQPPRLQVKDLRAGQAGQHGLIDGLNLQVMPGEIVGIAGVSGNGQRELMAALTGTIPMAGGTLAIDGKPYVPTRTAMTERGVRSLPEEPLFNACVGKLSVAENLALRNFDRPPLKAGVRLSARAMRSQALEAIAAFNVKTPGPATPIENLSGGNVQRAVLARELGAFNDAKPRLLLVANPCFGLDFQAAAEIHARLRSARDQGCGVLLLSEDLDEILALASRVLVMSHGRIVHECPAAQADLGVIGRAMAGDAHVETLQEPA
jgi:general nucleoside transport system ATP-binding protein